MALRSIVKALSRKFGIEIKRYQEEISDERCSLLGSMRTAAALGFTPTTILDVGAARGLWSKEVAKVWPEAHYLMIEPLVENEAALWNICRALTRAEYRLSVASEKSGVNSINVHPDLDGSSLFLERELNINGLPRQVNALAIDSLEKELGLKGPFLIKADVQGAELKVLVGAKHVLPDTEMLVLEVVLYDIYQGKGPQLYDIVSYLKTKGFVAWDIFGNGYRMVDNALCQVDMVFVKEKGVFRKVHQYATEEQRLQQLASISKNSPERLWIRK
jgi:FkbM family methyltransferase